MSRESLKFHVIDVNPVKNTVTLHPTFGTLIKMNVTAAGLLYCSHLIAKMLIDDYEDARNLRLAKEAPTEN